MIILTIFKEAILKNGARILKVLGWGGGAVTAQEAAPFGDDGCPLPNIRAVYMETGNKAHPVIVGYLNNQQIAGPGEKRLYSLNTDGSVSFYIHMKSDGTIEIGGNSGNLVKYTELNSALTQQNGLINTELAKIQAAISALGGVYAHVNVNTDISASKTDHIKV